MTELDRTQQRIIGALLEKELAVPESYPLTENALLAACNQKSNRDPEMGLETFEMHGALMALMTADWAKTASSTARATRYAHRLDSHYAVNDREKAVICELLVRGPQAAGALKPRVARLGYAATPQEIDAVLHELTQKSVPMVEMLPKRPRERDHRWCHLLGPVDPAHEAAGVAAGDSAPVVAVSVPRPVVAPDMERRVEQLEERVAFLEAELHRFAQNE